MFGRLLVEIKGEGFLMSRIKGMTREEAIKWFETHMPTKIMPAAKAAYEMALTALRPVSREQVEKVWRGEWMFPIFADQEDANDPRCQCSKCGSIETPLAKHRFCPFCGAPMTDEAVDMVMERWKEAVSNENS